ncbi:beta-ketoacyl-[acyl-carrier-protein] synthase family protein [Actinokineospora sp.]|uniref:beta-ketoacyl-[acyl-carrier-protein] synthase family protein n=1 Tax=Actinokineospora sp. TaxID=1872133 RepID=UPI004038039B
MDRPPEQRVVITGLGAVTCLADNVPDLWSGLVGGRSGITNWKDMDDRVACRVAGDLSDFDLDEHLDRVGADYPAELTKAAKRILRVTPHSGTLTAAAALQAYVDAGFGVHPPESERIGHVLAGHNLNTPNIVANSRTFAEEPEFIDPLFGMVNLDTDVVGAVGELLSLRGPGFMIGGACASGNLAALNGLDMIRAGRADAVVVTGGTIAMDPLVVHSWVIIEALTFTSFNDDPTRASRPFDARREGFVPSEGSAAVVIESLASARRRGATIYAELLGGAAASDANRQTRPHQEGQRRAMRGALADARVTAEQIDYVNAHATSTPLGDAVEVAAVKEVLGERAPHTPMNSTKSMVGHSLTSAGVIEMIATTLQIRHGVLHPTINQETEDPALGLDFVPNVAREHRIDTAISNSFGFGGINSCLVIGSHR